MQSLFKALVVPHKAEAVACRTNALTAHLISPTAATGAKFVMLLAKLGKQGRSGQPPKGVERCGKVLSTYYHPAIPVVSIPLLFRDGKCMNSMTIGMQDACGVLSHYAQTRCVGLLSLLLSHAVLFLCLRAA